MKWRIFFSSQLDCGHSDDCGRLLQRISEETRFNNEMTTDSVELIQTIKTTRSLLVSIAFRDSIRSKITSERYHLITDTIIKRITECEPPTTPYTIAADGLVHRALKNWLFIEKPIPHRLVSSYLILSQLNQSLSTRVDPDLNNISAYKQILNSAIASGDYRLGGALLTSEEVQKSIKKNGYLSHYREYVEKCAEMMDVTLMTPTVMGEFISLAKTSGDGAQLSPQHPGGESEGVRCRKLRAVVGSWLRLPSDDSNCFPVPELVLVPDGGMSRILLNELFEVMSVSEDEARDLPIPEDLEIVPQCWFSDSGGNVYVECSLDEKTLRLCTFIDDHWTVTSYRRQHFSRSDSGGLLIRLFRFICTNKTDTKGLTSIKGTLNRIGSEKALTGFPLRLFSYLMEDSNIRSLNALTTSFIAVDRLSSSSLSQFPTRISDNSYSNIRMIVSLLGWMCSNSIEITANLGSSCITCLQAISSQLLSDCGLPSLLKSVCLSTINSFDGDWVWLDASPGPPFGASERITLRISGWQCNLLSGGVDMAVPGCDEATFVTYTSEGVTLSFDELSIQITQKKHSKYLATWNLRSESGQSLLCRIEPFPPSLDSDLMLDAISNKLWVIKPSSKTEDDPSPITIIGVYPLIVDSVGVQESASPKSDSKCNNSYVLISNFYETVEDDLFVVCSWDITPPTSSPRKKDSSQKYVSSTGFNGSCLKGSTTVTATGEKVCFEVLLKDINDDRLNAVITIIVDGCEHQRKEVVFQAPTSSLDPRLCLGYNALAKQISEVHSTQEGTVGGLQSQSARAAILEYLPGVKIDSVIADTSSILVPGLFGTFNKVCSQLVRHSSLTESSRLDRWLFGSTGTSATAPLGVDSDIACRLVVFHYCQVRVVNYSSPPPVASEDGVFVLPAWFQENVSDSVATIRSSIRNNTISRRDLQRVSKRIDDWTQLCDGNFADEVAATIKQFDTAMQQLMKQRKIINDLLSKWGIGDSAKTAVAHLGAIIRDKEDVHLSKLFSEAARLSSTLSETLNYDSVLLRCQFTVIRPQEGEISLDDQFPELLKKASNRIREFTPDCSCLQILTKTLSYSEVSSASEERLLLQHLKVESNITDLIVNGAFPLSGMVSDLSAFRLLAATIDPDLEIRSDLKEAIPEVLLDPNLLEKVSLQSAEETVQQIKDLTAGCDHRVFRIIKVVIENCSELIKFIRCNPEAQDRGVASVLWNNRDAKHVILQSFLDCCGYINPIIAITKKQAELHSQNTQGIVRVPIETLSDFWEAMHLAVSACKSGADHFISAVENMLCEASTEDKIQELQDILSEQNGSTDRLFKTIDSVVDSGASVIIDIPPLGIPTLSVLVTSLNESKPLYKPTKSTTTVSLSQYQELICRAALHQDLLESLPVFLSQAREVLLCYNSICRLAEEGHVLYRARTISLPHNVDESCDYHYSKLQLLYGTWKDIFATSCRKYPIIGCITATEVTRLVCYYKDIKSIQLNGNSDCNAKPLTESILFSERGILAEHVSPISEVTDTLLLPDRITPLRTPMPTISDFPEVPILPNVISISGPLMGDAAGMYRPGPPVYKNTNNNIVLTQSNYVGGGWCCFDPDRNEILLESAQRCRNSRPWEAVHWKDSRYSKLISGELTVSPDDSEVTPQRWSRVDTSTTRDTTVVVSIGEGRGVVGGFSHKRIGSHLYIDSIEPYSPWHAAGLEAGMRIIGVNNDRGDAATLQELLSLALKVNRPITFQVIPSWVWHIATPGVDITSSGSGVTRIFSKKSDAKGNHNIQQRAVVISPAEGPVWQVLVTGDVFGFRIGLCVTECLQMPQGQTATTNKLSQLATTTNSQVYWYLRPGILRHAGVDIQTSTSIKSGDVITVERCLTSATITFYINGVRVPQCFRNVPPGKLHPICSLIKNGCKVELSQSKPTISGHRWSEEHRHHSTALSECNQTATRVPSDSGTYSVVTGESILEGPGPHRFDIIIKGRQIADCLVGLVPTDTRLDRQLDPLSASVGILLRPDGTLVGNRESKVLHSLTMQKKRVAQGDVLTFIVHLGLPSLEFRKNNETVYNSILTDTTSIPKLKGPLLPCCILANSDTSVSFLNVPGVDDNCYIDIPIEMLLNNNQMQGRVPESVDEDDAPVVDCKKAVLSPNVVVQGAQYSASANGVYREIPNRFFVHEKDTHAVSFDKTASRWILSTVAGRIISASSCCSDDTPPTDPELRWVLQGSQPPSIYPITLLLTLPHVDATVFTLCSEGDDVVYSAPSCELSKSGLRLSVDSDSKCWVITAASDAEQSKRVPLLRARFPTAAPQLCESWGYGNGKTFMFDDRIVVSASDNNRDLSTTPLDKERHLVTAIQPTGYPTDVQCVKSTLPQPSSIVYHILRSISKKLVGSELLVESTFTRLSNNDHDELTLDQLGSFLSDGVTSLGGGLGLNFVFSATSQSVARLSDPYAHIQSSKVTQFMISVAPLKPVDQKLFTYTLFSPAGGSTCEQLSDANYLECYSGISEMEVYRFLALYDAIKSGRMVVSGVQKLPSELYGLVKSKAASSEKKFYAKTENKQLLAVVTSVVGDETIPQLDSTVCDIRWKRSSCAALSQSSKFTSVTYFDQPQGTGKTFSLEAKRAAILKANEERNPVSFILDLDSTTSELDHICSRLLLPFSHPVGVLTINIACDTPVWLANVVLDSLLLLGKLCSPSGISVCTPSDWDLLVEIEDSGKGPPDFILTSSRGLADRGELIPFEISNKGPADGVLQFLKGGRDVLPDSEVDILNMIASGVSEVPDTSNSEELEAFRERLSKNGTSRINSRILNFLKHKWVPYTKSKGFGEPDLDRLVVQCMRHEAMHFVYPNMKDHFHLTTTDTIRTIRVQLSGEMPESIKVAVDAYLEYIMRLTNASQNPRPYSLEATSSQPLHLLVGVLAEVIGIRSKTCMKLLTDSGYILISGYLQKLIQLHTHITLKDPIILAGASGTGKTSTVDLLAQMLQAPMGVAGASPLYALYQFIRHDGKLKNLFSNGISDMVGDRENVLWHAECRFGYDAVIDCIKVLRKEENVPAIQLLCMTVADTMGPVINNESGNPEIASARSRNQDLHDAIDIVLQTNSDCSSCTTKAGVLKDALHLFTKEISKIGGGYLSQQLTNCLEQAIRSEPMEKLVGKLTSDLMNQILTKDHRKDSILEWAADAVARSTTMFQNNGKILTSLVRKHIREHLKAHPILQPSNKLLEMLSIGDGGVPSGAQLSQMLVEYLENTSNIPVFVSVLMKYGMTSRELYTALEPTFIKAHQCPEVVFVVMFDELNATHMLGLIKRIVVDRRWDAWPHDSLPSNIAFVGAINPSESFDGQPLPPSLSHYVVPWNHLDHDQQLLFVSRLVSANSVLYRHHVHPDRCSMFGKIILHSHNCSTTLLNQADLGEVSQRDIHRCMKSFEYFFNRFPESCFPITDPDMSQTEKTHLRSLSALLLAVSICYYFRLPQKLRSVFANSLTDYVNRLFEEESTTSPFKTTSTFNNLTHLIQVAIDHYCDPSHLDLPEAVCRHQGLLEILFVQIISLELRLAVILCGPPGTSKTLSNNILKVNMTGRPPFWDTVCSISEICIYQGSQQSSGLEVRRKCDEAVTAQRLYDTLGHSSKRCLLFIDEAGLATSTQKWALKSLHSYLENGEIASVLITNQRLDPAVTNRCIEIRLEDPDSEDLAQICFGILGISGSSPHNNGNVNAIVVQSCTAFRRLVQLSSYNAWWFGLRDLFHYMRFLRRRQRLNASLPSSSQHDQNAINFTIQDVALGIQRNFNGEKHIFSTVVTIFGETLSQHLSLKEFTSENIRSQLLNNDVDVVLSSIADANRTLKAQSNHNLNLNDLWVRFKLVTDSTPDGCILQMLRHANVREFFDVQVISLSELSSKDPLQPVTVISSITAAMEAGKFVWLTNTRSIDTALFDVLNQCYVVATNSSGETVHHSAVAMGPTLQYKQIHTNFQCVIHVTADEVRKGSTVLTSPFLNRLEKFSLNVDDVLKHCIQRLSEPEQHQISDYRSRLLSFATSLLGPDSAKDTLVDDTVNSVVLESITHMMIKPIPPNRMIRRAVEGQSTFPEDYIEWLKAFYQPTWRTLALRFLQVVPPAVMLAAQEGMVSGPSGYLLIYYVVYKNWKPTRTIQYVVDSAEAANTATGSGSVYGSSASLTSSRGRWLKVLIQLPDNADITSLVKRIPRHHTINVNTLLRTERGLEVFHELIHRFCSDQTNHTLIVIFGPQSQGRPEVREIKNILEHHPGTGQNRKLSKAVVLIQPISYETISPVVGAHFASGWDVFYLDASVEALDVNLQRFAPRSILPTTTVPAPIPVTWKTIFEPLISQSLRLIWDITLTSSDVPPSPLYDVTGAFPARINAAISLFDACPTVRHTLVELYTRRLPSNAEIGSLAGEVARDYFIRAREEKVSITQLLLDEENRAAVGLLAVGLRFLLDDGNADALSNNPSQGLGDVLIAGAIRDCIEENNQTFQSLRRHHVALLDEMQISSTIKGTGLEVHGVTPKLPGSSALVWLLRIPKNPPHLSPPMMCDWLLKSCSTSSVVIKLVEQVNADPEMLQFFIYDLIRGILSHPSSDVVKLVTPVVIALFLQQHDKHFSELSVFSIMAVFLVSNLILREYVVCLVPMGITKFIDSECLVDVLSPMSPTELSKVFCAKQVIKRLKSFLGNSQPCPSLDPGSFKLVISSIIHRHTANEILSNCQLAVLKVVSLVLCQPDSDEIFRTAESISDLVLSSLNKRSLCSQSLRKLMFSGLLQAWVIGEISLFLCELCVHLQGNSGCGDKVALLQLILDLIKDGKVERGPSCSCLSVIIGTQPDEGLMTLSEAIYTTEGTSMVAAMFEPAPKIRYISPNKSNLYTAVTDVYVDYFMGRRGNASMSEKSLLSMVDQYLVVQNEIDNQPVLIHRKYVFSCQLSAMSYFLLKCLATLVATNPDRIEHLDTPKVRGVVRTLLEPPGFVCPAPGTENDPTNAVPVDNNIEDNMSIFLLQIETSLGTKDMLVLLRSFATNASVHPAIRLCGEYFQLKCINAQPLTTKPGDLPFVYMLSSSLHEPYLLIKKQLALVADGIAPPQQLITLIKSLTTVEASETTDDIPAAISLENVRLLIYFCTLRLYFRESQIFAGENDALRLSLITCLTETLQLNPAQNRLLTVALDHRCLLENADASLGIVSELLKGDSHWTEFACNIWAVGAAMPETFVGTLLLNADAQKGSYLPGDKTGVSISQGGCFKFDCVTQLDENGVIDSCARGQAHLNTGSCYLLWGVEFTALALNLTIFPSSFDTLWNWYFSTILQSRTFSYQRGLSNRNHLINQLTERSIAYHLHMGTNTGLSLDEAQRMFAFFLNNLLTHDPETDLLLNTSFAAHSEAAEAEKQIESYWLRMSTTNRTILSRPPSDMCLTLKQLTSWSENNRPFLPNTSVISKQTSSFSQNMRTRVVLAELCLFHKETLELSMPLIISLYQFASKVYNVLGRSILRSSVSQSVIKFIYQVGGGEQGREAAEDLAQLKILWNRYIDTVGALDYECEAGGLNVALTEENSLVDTIDFWIVGGPELPSNQNLCRAALNALVQKYNNLVSQLQKTPNFPVIDDVSLQLFPRQNCGMQLKYIPIDTACRSHTTASRETNWHALEDVVALRSGLLIPKLQLFKIPVFILKQPSPGTPLVVAELRAEKILETCPPHFDEGISAGVHSQLDAASYGFTMEQISAVLSSLCDIIEANPEPHQVLHPLLQLQLETSDSEDISDALYIPEIHVRNCKQLIQFYHKKAKELAWITDLKSIPEKYSEELSSSQQEDIRNQYKSSDDKELELVHGLLVKALQHCEYLNVAMTIEEFITTVIGDTVSEKLSISVRHTVSLLKLIRSIQKERLTSPPDISKRIEAGSFEDLDDILSSAVPQLHFDIELEEASGIHVDSDMRVVIPTGSKRPPPIDTGMQIVAVDGVVASTPETFKRLISEDSCSPRNRIFISVATPKNLTKVKRSSNHSNWGDDMLSSGTDDDSPELQQDTPLPRTFSSRMASFRNRYKVSGDPESLIKKKEELKQRIANLTTQLQQKEQLLALNNRQCADYQHRVTQIKESLQESSS